ncbi:MAG: uroporphyrinogen decarboxylase family protein [Verrucomicrobiales bacterium]|nr:uroporphyrinogen decarboxylase family protein [Verrucomicrobiales bacterium]
MTPEQWDTVRRCAAGEPMNSPPVALIIDSPWLPGYLGLSTLDYLFDSAVWLQANVRVAAEFPEIIFLPGFWAEIGMTAEPSAFGCRVSLYPDRTPVAHHVIRDMDELDRLPQPDPLTDGFLPVLLSQYRRLESQINDAGHVVKMVAARGPLTTATHLMGVTNFLLALKLQPSATHRLLQITTRLTREWLAAQAETLADVEGVLVLDDIAGMMSAKDYQEFAHPYLKEVFDAFPGALKMFHNDTDNPVAYPLLPGLGIDVFNFTHLRPLAKVREMVGPELCLLGNVPPLEVLAQGTPDDVAAAARACLDQHPAARGLMLSAGGGTSPGTSGDNLRALVQAVRQATG